MANMRKNRNVPEVIIYDYLALTRGHGCHPSTCIPSHFAFVCRECECCLGPEWEVIKLGLNGSPVWKHFARRKGCGKPLVQKQCVKCHKILKSQGYKRLRSHMKSIHGIEHADRHTVSQNFVVRKKSGHEMKTCKCLICHKLLTAQLTTLRNHLKSVHSIKVKKNR